MNAVSGWDSAPHDGTAYAERQQGRSGGSARGPVIWEPSEADTEASTLTAFMRWLDEFRGLSFTGYADLWDWSVREYELFWAALWEYFQVEASVPYDRVCQGDSLQTMEWFPGARLNFAQHLLRYERTRPDATAMICYNEDGARNDWSWSELADAVRRVATGLRALGIRPGDRVAGYVPNSAQAAIALIATTAIGAIWSSCSPEFGASISLDRLGQIEPRLIFAVSHYGYAGKDRDRRATLDEILSGLPSAEHVILLNDTEWCPAVSAAIVSTWESLLASPSGPEAFHFEQVASDHPLWIVYTSGTSGPPKAIVHSHIGALMGAMKDVHFHLEATHTSVLLFYSTTGWIIWNMLISSLSLGATVVLYEGSPFYPDVGTLWRQIDDARVTVFTTSPGFITKLIDTSYVPTARHAIDTLEALVLVGAVVEDALYDWLVPALPPRVRIFSQAGSTEICGGYAGSVRLLPTRAGEITARALGMNVEAVDGQARRLRNQPGELVICAPFPNAPRRLWNDPTGARFSEAYLAGHAGWWRQGDVITIYDDGACRVHGRSDATIKRRGIRIGSNEIYRVLGSLAGVSDAIVVCPEAGVWRGQLMLFVQRPSGAPPDDGTLHHRINDIIEDALSPRHVPDQIIDTPAIPYTVTGKRLEVPLRRLLERNLSHRDFAASLPHDPDTLRWYTAFSAAQ
ncbi:acetoacetate--CoA ligase [Sphingomonas panacis]|uniref:acetoacetate--CoA ligase n=1 Tax=Sphingomonas panacis TaxID=1560345 RepID=UPI000ABD401B|nr:acetoacetate--CoA ligase [Sphingomonas panacis]